MKRFKNQTNCKLKIYLFNPKQNVQNKKGSPHAFETRAHVFVSPHWRGETALSAHKLFCSRNPQRKSAAVPRAPRRQRACSDLLTLVNVQLAMCNVQFEFRNSLLINH